MIEADIKQGIKLQGHIMAAFSRIQLASDELAKIVHGTPDANSDIRDVASYIFKPQDLASISARLHRLHLSNHGYISNRYNEKTQDMDWTRAMPGRNDMVSLHSMQPGSKHMMSLTAHLKVIYCTGARFEPNPNDDPPRAFDKIWRVSIHLEEYQHCFIKDHSGLEAFTVPSDGHHGEDPLHIRPDILQLCPRWVLPPVCNLAA